MWIFYYFNNTSQSKHILRVLSSCLISPHKPPERIYSLYLHLTLSNCLCDWVQTLQAPARLSVVRLRLLTHLTVEQRVVVPPHLRVNIVEVPLKAFTLQTLPQCNPLRDVSIINTMVLQEQTSHWGGEVFALQRIFFSPAWILKMVFYNFWTQILLWYFF